MVLTWDSDGELCGPGCQDKEQLGTGGYEHMDILATQLK